MPEFRAHHDNVLIEPHKVSMTTGGIALPDSVDPEIQIKTGTVLYVGPGVLCESGDRVACQTSAGAVVEYYCFRARKRVIHGKELDLVRDNDVIGTHVPQGD